MARAAAPLESLRRLKSYSDGINAARRVFSGNLSAMKFLASAPTIQSIPNFGGIPEVILVGRANVGKSSLINFICMRNRLAITSSTPGRTQALNFFSVQKLKGKGLNTVLVDAPGYGARGRPEWGKLFDHYIRTRQELRRVYILINAEHGVTADDKFMLQFLGPESQRIKRFSVQPVLTKLDKVPLPLVSRVVESHQQAISEASPICLPVIQTATGRRKMGRVPLQHSILQACGWIPQLQPIPNDNVEKQR